MFIYLVGYAIILANVGAIQPINKPFSDQNVKSYHNKSIVEWVK